MKKLMIALAAAAAITGVAKADIDNHVTDFESENLEVGAAFDATLDDEGTQTGAKYWAIEEGATEPYAIVTNASFNGENRAGKALSIDTDKLLSRKVKAGNAGAESFETAPLYFDGYVQFTAADSLPETEAGDKLVVWLYGGDADTDAATATALGLEDKVSTNLVITAGEVNTDTWEVSKTNFLVSSSALSIAPNSWHRLTIKALADIGGYANAVRGFKVYVDGNPISVGGTSAFPSLIANGENDDLTLTSVSFKGTGAVDDLGFTAVDLFPEAQPFDYAVTISDEDETGATATYAVDGTSVSLVNGVLKVNPSATTVTFVVAVAEGYKLANEGATKGAYDIAAETYAWTLNVAVSSLEKDGSDAITLSVVEDGAATTYELTLTAGEGTTLTAKKTSDNSPINTGTYLPAGTEIIITAAISDDTAYEDLVVTVGGSQVVLNANGEYTFMIGENTKVVASSATAIQPADWPAVNDIPANTTVNTQYGISGALANADAKVFTTWAAGNGGVAYANRSSTTYNVDCFLLNIANDSNAAAIAAAKEEFKVTSISVAADGTVTITPADGAKYGNGKVVVEGSAALPASWHNKTDGDYFFRVKLVVDEVPVN